MNSSLKRSLLLGGVLALSLAGIVSAAVIKGQPTARSDGSSITIHWDSDDETGLVGYEIARKAGWDGQYIVLMPSYKLKGSNQPYDFVDETAFRTTGTYYKYRITALYANGARSDPYETGVSHYVSSVRRTWGSIKAMFR
jgi:hypothetical protein